jgi:hypothetical protein
MFRSIKLKAPGTIVKKSVNEPTLRGVTAVDGMIPIRHGQRESILGDRITGKTIIVIDSTIDQSFIHSSDLKSLLLFILLFCILLFLSCVYLYKQLENWISPNTLLIYSKKKLLIPFFSFYFLNIIGLLCMLYLCFNDIFINLMFSLKVLLIIFMITIITLAFIVTLYIKTIKEQYVIKYAKSPRDYFSPVFENFKAQCKFLANGIVLDIKNNSNITEIYRSTKKYYNGLNITGGFSFFIKKRNFLLNIFIKWLEFYIFLLNLFLIILTFSYFYYFNINFQLDICVISSLYVYSFLFLVFVIRFYQNYFILLKIKNNLPKRILAVSVFNKENQKYFFFTISEKFTFIRWVIRWILPIIFFFIFLLINCRIISIIYAKIYKKNIISLFTFFSNIIFGPILNNFIVLNNAVNYTFYYLLNCFIYIFLLITLLLLIVICLSFYFKILLYIVTEPLVNTNIVQLKYNDFTLLPEDLESDLIDELRAGIKKINVNYSQIKPAQEYHVIWFKNLIFFFTRNYNLYGLKKFIFYLNNLYMLIGSLLGVILLFFIMFAIFIYYNTCYEINLFNFLFLPLITIHKRFMRRSGGRFSKPPNSKFSSTKSPFSSFFTERHGIGITVHHDYRNDQVIVRFPVPEDKVQQKYISQILKIYRNHNPHATKLLRKFYREQAMTDKKKVVNNSNAVTQKKAKSSSDGKKDQLIQKGRRLRVPGYQTPAERKEETRIPQASSIKSPSINDSQLKEQESVKKFYEGLNQLNYRERYEDVYDRRWTTFLLQECGLKEVPPMPKEYQDKLLFNQFKNDFVKGLGQGLGQTLGKNASNYTVVEFTSQSPTSSSSSSSSTPSSSSSQLLPSKENQVDNPPTNTSSTQTPPTPSPTELSVSPPDMS